MSRSVTIEITFVGIGSVADPGAQGVVHLPDGTLHTFCGWIDLLAALEGVASDSDGVRDQ